MADTLTWLHLSDLHMQDKELHNIQTVLDTLWKDLPVQINELGGRLDFVAFTGDIAFSGKAEEYELAEEHFFQPLLEVTGLTPERLFIVPGNHDVDWEAISLINPQIALSLSERNKVTDLLKDDFKRRLLFSPMTSYTQFVQRYFASFPDHQILRDPPYYYVQRITLDGRSVALIGLNSAWFSGFTKDERKKITDRGNLLIGDKQIGDAIREVEGATVRIALMHHPPSCLKEFDELDVQRWLRPGCDFVLRGHIHVPNFEQEKALSRETINIPAGTIYKSREWLNGYNMVQLNFAGKGKIILRRYSEDRREWVRDIQSTGDELAGLVEFDLPGSLASSVSQPPPLASSASRVLSKIKPCWLRLGREREVQLLEAFLKHEAKDTLWVWGNKGCGLTEFLQIAQALCAHENVVVIYFDADDATAGIAVDQHYFLDKLERRSDATPKTFHSEPAESTDTRLERLLNEGHWIKFGQRLILIFANYHLLIPTIREWVSTKLWDQMLELRKEHKLRAIFACEGSPPACPASEQDDRIYLGEFTVQDVERFLQTLGSINFEEVPKLARKIHSKSDGEFLAPPQRVYKNLIAEMVLRDLCGRHE